LDAARRLVGRIGCLPASGWWATLLIVAWYSGARIAALLQVRWDDLRPTDGGLLLRAEASKTKEDQFVDLPASVFETLEAIRFPTRDLVWPWPWHPRRLFLVFADLAAEAGLPLPKSRGKFHRIRRSTASYLKAAGGDPTARLGHSSPSVTARYLDPRICGNARQSHLLPPV
jgi:integrase